MDALIEELLRDAAAAHGAYEADELDGVYDEQWPQWYAAHIARALQLRGLEIVPGALGGRSAP